MKLELLKLIENLNENEIEYLHTFVKGLFYSQLEETA